MRKSHQISVQRSRSTGQQSRQTIARNIKRTHAQNDFNRQRTAAIGHYLKQQSSPHKSSSGLGTAAVGAGVGAVFGGPLGAVIGGGVGWVIGKLG